MAGAGGFDEIEEDRGGGPTEGGDVTRGGAGPLGGGGAGDFWPPMGGGPAGGGVGPVDGGWLGKGELMTPAALGVPFREEDLETPKPSGKSFHAGRFVAVV